jgi:hypothetical protein
VQINSLVAPVHDKTIIPTRKISKNERVLNEFGSKIENEEKLDAVVEAREPGDRSLHDILPFDCECDDKGCTETISMSTEEYKQVHHRTNNFAVIPSHVRLDIEEVTTTFSNYVTVKKLFPRPSGS